MSSLLVGAERSPPLQDGPRSAGNSSGWDSGSWRCGRPTRSIRPSDAGDAAAIHPRLHGQPRGLLANRRHRRIAVLDALARREGIGHDADGALAAGRGLAREDLFATATALSARSIARSLRDHAPAWPARLWVGGGGTRNPTLMRALGDALHAATPPGASVPRMRDVEAAGIPSGSKEAIAFAFLGHETLHGRTSSLVGATGARHPSVLGAIWPAGQGARRHDVGEALPGGLVRHLRVRDGAAHSRGVEGS